MQHRCRAHDLGGLVVWKRQKTGPCAWPGDAEIRNSVSHTCDQQADQSASPASSSKLHGSSSHFALPLLNERNLLPIVIHILTHTLSGCQQHACQSQCSGKQPGHRHLPSGHLISGMLLCPSCELCLSAPVGRSGRGGWCQNIPTFHAFLCCIPMCCVHTALRLSHPAWLCSETGACNWPSHGCIQAPLTLNLSPGAHAGV